MKLILASASPRRRELLRLITEDFLVHNSNAEETLPPDLSPAAAVELLARRKALSVQRQFPQDAVIGSDTVVALGGTILGKPTDPADACAMLSRLSGRSHEVFTGVCLALPNAAPHTFVSRAQVHFSPMTGEEIRAYVESGEPMDKAGAYGIQGKGARFVEQIEGDYYTVMGLPVCKLYHLMRELGLVSVPLSPHIP
ncbi:MAG: septum formation inhibitor Maf [Oscillospiraceae bacterium]|nr:MAG: septum formation inhibitor Maf [Oscillospiraceae bacterium]